jgi:retron-type reverse transcriptase
MKRAGGLFPDIVGFRNLLEAERRAARGKRHRPTVQAFEMDLERELIRLQEELVDHSYRPGPFVTFEVHDPKRRAICAAPFRDRVVHHAICDVLEPVFERRAVHDSYACRRGKGSHAAIRRAQSVARRWPYVLQCDVRRFFASVDHDVLRALLARVLKDRDVLALLDRIIDHPPPDALPGRGLPIGNLTSQHFANLVLGELDHHLKDHLALPGYIRYMDDFLLFGADKATLQELHAEIRRFLDDRLRLELKPSAAPVNPVSEGIGFLGFRIYPRTIRLDQCARRRFLRKVRDIERAYQDGAIDLAELSSRASSLYAHAGHADSWRLRRRVAGNSMVDG